MKKTFLRVASSAALVAALASGCGFESSGVTEVPEDFDAAGDTLGVADASSDTRDTVDSSVPPDTGGDVSTDSDFDTGSGDSGTGDTASTDTGTSDTGTADTGTTDTGTTDTGTTDTGTTDTGAVDSGLTDSGTSDSGTDAGTDAGCAPLATGAIDVYVDKASTKASVGTAECPFKTILEGAALAAPSSTRVIHVKGGSPLVTYTEAGVVRLKRGVTLLGDGVGSVRIAGGGFCTEVSGTCTVVVGDGATLDSVSVTSTGTAIVTAATTSTGKAVVKNALATLAGGDGIITLGAADLGPNVTSRSNGGDGLHSFGAGLVHVLTTGTFDSNGNAGIEMEGTAQLQFDGGSASSNGGRNVTLASTSAVKHTITGMTCQNSGPSASGMVVINPSSLVLRNSTLTKNAFFGMRFIFGGGNTLDIGTSGSPGNNIFAGATEKNVSGGICLDNSGATGSQPAANDKWSVCAPSQKAVSSCTVGSTGGYTDIGYNGTGSNPVAVSACTVGP